MQNRVYIVGGGESLIGFDFSVLRGKDVIAINKSILDVPFAKYFITMDYSFVDKKSDATIFDNNEAKKYFVVALNNDYIKYQDNAYVDTRTNYRYDLSRFDEIIVSKADSGIGASFEDFVHGCNSGFSALQLAILLGYKEIYLLGIDMDADNNTHYHHRYSENLQYFRRRLRFYFPYFVKGLKAIKEKFSEVKVYSCSNNCPLNKHIEFVALKDLK